MRRRVLMIVGLVLGVLVALAVVVAARTWHTARTTPPLYLGNAPPSIDWPLFVSCEHAGVRDYRCRPSAPTTHRLDTVWVGEGPNARISQSADGLFNPCHLFARCRWLVCTPPALQDGGFDCLYWDGSELRIPREVAVYRNT